MLKLVPHLILAAGGLGSLASCQAPSIRQIWTFPPNTFIENIAVRSNSHLLLTSESVPTLFTLDPHRPADNFSNPSLPPILHTFPNATGLSGITELPSPPDVFAVVSGTWDLVNTRAALGSLNIWTIDLRTPIPVVKHIANIANSTIFNGLASLPGSNPPLILAADSAIGAIWRVNILTGACSITFSSPFLAPLGTSPGTNLGVNGIRTSSNGKYLYFTNSAQGIFGRVRINSCGEKIGEVEVLASAGVVPSGVTGVHFDDFAFSESEVWIATHPSDVIGVNLKEALQTGNATLRDIKNETLLLNPTSAAFGRGGEKERRTLYVTNGGTFVGDTFELVEEGVVAVDLGSV